MTSGADHPLVFESADYRVHLDSERLTATVLDPGGAPWFVLRLLHAVDSLDGVDETLAVTDIGVTRHDGQTAIRVRVRSSRWAERWTELCCRPDGLSLTGGISGSGKVLAVHAFGGYRPPGGFLPSGSALRSVLSPNPDHPRRVVRDAVESAVIAVVGAGSEPGLGRWLFTPAPWCLAVSRSERVGDQRPPVGPWAWIGLMAPIEEQNFTALHYLPTPEGFSLRLDYEGHTEVAGTFLLPRIDIGFGADDPFSAIAEYGSALRAQGLVPAIGRREQPWWREPMFCGWGAQNALAGPAGGAPAQCTQANYDSFLTALADRGIVPGTIVVDDKWAEHYASCHPDPAKWPDLAGWIRDRHDAGQRVLLWWKAWDTDGAPEDACIRLPDGTPVAIDPGSPAGERIVREAVHTMLSPDCLDADGLKIDFTAATPSGVSLQSAGPRWGAALLHRLLSLAHTTARRVRPDALIITHTPNPAFADVADMIRLNDVMMLDAVNPDVDVVSHMTYRAAVVRAAMPGMPIDTDGWCMPDRESWRAYVPVQPSLGVPALYYATAFDRTGEILSAEDYQWQRTTWERYRAGLTT